MQKLYLEALAEGGGRILVSDGIFAVKIYRYATWDEAVEAFNEWSRIGDPPGHWVADKPTHEHT